MIKKQSQQDALLFSDLDLRTPLSSMPRQKADFRFLNPLKWLVIIVLSGVFTGGAVTLIWYAYMQGYDEASAEHAPEIIADDAPFKVRPENPGGLQVPHQNRQVYEVMRGGKVAGRVESLMPVPEMPLAREIPEEEVLPAEPEEAIQQPVTEKKVPAKKPVLTQISKKPVAKVKAKPAPAQKEVAPASPAAKVRLQFGVLPSVAAAEREVARLKYQYRTALNSLYLSSAAVTKKQGKMYRVQSQRMSLKEAEKIQKTLKNKKITAIILK